MNIKNRKKSIALLPLVAFIWLLLQLGTITINSSKNIFKFFKKIHFNFPKINLPRIVLPTVNFPSIKLPELNIHLPLKRHRGRPRKQFIIFFTLKKIKRFLRKLIPSPVRIAVGLSLFLIGFFFYSFFLIILAHDLPSPQNIISLSGPVTTEFYDRNGHLLYRLYDGKNRTLVSLKDISPQLIQATVAMEDKNFYAHSGVDIYGLARAGVAFFQNHEVQGGSTITQQLIKNTLLTPERTLTRKAKEIILSFWAERIYSKNDILQMYFNDVPYGGPAWGIAAASQTYFNKSPKDLDLAESAYLAALPASPTVYSPYGTNPELGKDRQLQVLRRMVEEKFITQKQSDDASKENLAIKPQLTDIKAPHFVMYIRSLLAQKYGEAVVSQGGLKVITTLDLDKQHMAEQVVSSEVSKLGPLDVSNGAAMITDAKTGQILAMVGSKNYWDSTDGAFNVTTALRQPGSSIKPVTYTTAFKQGYSPGSVILDAPVSYTNAWETYTPVNYDGKFHGPVSIRTALGSSYNIPAVKVLDAVGIPNMIQTAKDLGITTFSDPNRYGLSLTLGGGEVKMTEMMAMYGTFSQLGVRHDSQGILKITDNAGNVLEDNTSPDGVKVLDPGIAYMIDDVLSDQKAKIPAFGPHSQLEIQGHTVASKTGTTDNKKDNWTFGFTTAYVVGTWVGNNDGHPMNPNLASGVTGAAPIWNRIMTSLVKDQKDIAFSKPDNVIQGVVNGNKDLVLSETANLAQKKPNTTSSPYSITFTDPIQTITANRPDPSP